MIKNKKQKTKNNKYIEIVSDRNNFISLELEIDGAPYFFKRFIGYNEIFIDGEGERFSKKIFRQGDSETFSDWLLKKLGIELFQLNLGRNSWFVSFNDLFRLMYYDQETNPGKIIKSPDSENFITDSYVIRKSVFETL